MMRTSLWASSLLTAFVIGALASGSGCKSIEDACEEADCEAGTQLYSCKPTTGFKQYQCRADETDADFWCQSIAGKPAVFIACDGYGDEIGDGDGDGTSETGAAVPSWDPSSSVTYDQVSGHYLVDATFVAALRDDPGLILLDGARVEESPTGYYALESVTQGDLADAMGLQSGDLLVSVNNHDLDSIDSMVDAYYDLESGTTFTLTISRNSQAMDLTYIVVE